MVFSLSQDVSASTVFPPLGTARNGGADHLGALQNVIQACRRGALLPAVSTPTSFARFKQIAANPRAGGRLMNLPTAPIEPPTKPDPRKDKDLSYEQRQAKALFAKGKPFVKPLKNDRNNLPPQNPLLGPRTGSETRKGAKEEQKDEEALRKAFDDVSVAAKRNEATHEKILQEPAVTQEEKWAKEDEDAMRARDDRQEANTAKYIAAVKKLKELQEYMDTDPKDNVNYGQIWEWNINILKRRAQQAAQIADNAVLEAWRQQRMARDFSHEAMVAEAAAMRSLPAADAAKKGGRFDYKLTPEQFALYGEPRPAPGTELPVAPLVGGPGRELVRIRQELGLAPLPPDLLAAVAISVATGAWRPLAPPNLPAAQGLWAHWAGVTSSAPAAAFL